LQEKIFLALENIICYNWKRKQVSYSMHDQIILSLPID